MSQNQRSSIPAMDTIESILERLLRHGGEITDSLETEMNHAGRRANRRPSPPRAESPENDSSPELSAVPSLEISTSDIHKNKEKSPQKPADDITSDMLVPPEENGVKKEAKGSDHFLGVKSFPCVLGSRDGENVERMARVTFHRKVDSNWLLVRFEVNDTEGKTLLVLRTELLGQMMKNTVINGKPVQ